MKAPADFLSPEDLLLVDDSLLAMSSLGRKGWEGGVGSFSKGTDPIHEYFTLNI